MPYKWYYDLRENTITKDVLEDYVAVPGKNGVDCYSKNGHAVTVLTRQS